MNEQPHITLSNLFSSLTSLANNQPLKLSPQHVNLVDNSQVPTSSSQLITSVQTAMAAALIQQQFAASTQQATSQAQAKLSTNQPINFQSNLQTNSYTPHPIHLLHQPQPQPAPQQQHQRINYCTICNKELCNKYFMKTHMLKMHGINLGSEPTGSDDDSSPDNGADQEKPGEEPVERPTNFSRSASEPDRKKCTSSKGGASSRKKSCAPDGKQATTVMNGYAGNSMGGVVCDICNKELCSKYFLKVHKQNTHGITSDYQDTSQFIYPFPDAAASAICAQNVYLGSTQPTPATFYPPAAPLAMFSGALQGEPPQPATNLDLSSAINRVSPNKKQRLSQANNSSSILQQQPVLDDIEKKGGRPGPEEGVKQQFESIYRLLLAQQHHAPTSALKNPAPPQGPAGVQFDRMQAASNTMNSLMCLAQAPNPFALTALSPAMIVDNILRNQHMFKRSQPPTQTDAKKSNLSDSNNNNDSNKKHSSSTTGGNNRYFSHYTEACPMCDRRFKSIKWLKTHMMNDHKQEIAGYMQMSMQYSYANKSQQMAAAATVAALERQHNHMLAQQLSTTGLAGALGRQQQHPQQHPAFDPPFDSCFTGPHYQARASGAAKSPASTKLTAFEPTVSHPKLQFDADGGVFSEFAGPLESVDHVIDARSIKQLRCESPNSSFGQPASAYSSSSPLQLDAHQQHNKMQKASQYPASGLNFQLAPLPAGQLDLSRCLDDEESEEEQFTSRG